MKSENIAAISTPPGRGGVAVIRISGDSPLAVAEKMFSPKGKTPVGRFEPYRMYPGEIDCGTFCDYGLCVYFRAPHSFTGEDVVEFHCHGGTSIARGVLKRAVACGCRPAERGEFTKRAFMNGKLSLSSAEGLVDMINGESEAEVRAGYLLYAERLTGAAKELQDRLTEILAGIDADIDFPEEDIERTELLNVREPLEKMGKDLRALLSTYKTGKKIKDGVSVVLAGKPNTGKSSVLNALLGADKAIVSSVAGTTRDVVEGSLEIGGVRFNLYDTAGIRDSDDAIESIGIRRAKSLLEGADLVLFILDASEKMSAEDREIYDSLADKKARRVQQDGLGGRECRSASCGYTRFRQDGREYRRPARKDVSHEHARVSRGRAIHNRRAPLRRPAPCGEGDRRSLRGVRQRSARSFGNAFKRGVGSPRRDQRRDGERAYHR